MKMQLNHSTDITFSEYVKQLQNKCTTDVNSVQYCILQYMILEQEELLIRFVNELYKYDKKKQQKDRNNNNNKNIITIQKKNCGETMTITTIITEQTNVFFCLFVRLFVHSL